MGIAAASVGRHDGLAAVGPRPVPMSPTEIAWGWVPGSGESSRPSRRRGGPSAMLEAMEDAIRPALERSPCVVEFSGGRDSSAVLAVALRLARREGLPLPVAVTQRFAGLAETDEQSWQEQVVAALGVVDWERQTVDDELDLVGPVAAPSLRRHGVLWPPLAHTRLTTVVCAGGGSAVTGEGGDELFGVRRLTPVRQVIGRVVPIGRRSVGMAALAAAPVPVRRARFRALLAERLELRWLRPAARRALVDQLADDVARQPLDWRRGVLAHLRSPAVSVALHNLAALAAEVDVQLVHPFLDPGVAGACGAMAGPLGFQDRTRAMHAIFAGLLPDPVLERHGKARFNRAVFHRHSRSFVERFTGAGVRSDLVDEEALVDAWKADEPDAMTFALLQWCWLAADAPIVRPGP